jgi:hypothetical protein
MRTIQTALAETLAHFPSSLHAQILPDPDLETRWRIEIDDPEVPNSLLEVEILELEGDAVGCVLYRRHIPVWMMNRFMNLLMQRLETSPHPPGGDPTT